MSQMSSASNHSVTLPQGCAGDGTTQPFDGLPAGVLASVREAISLLSDARDAGRSLAALLPRLLTSSLAPGLLADLGGICQLLGEQGAAARRFARAPDTPTAANHGAGQTISRDASCGAGIGNGHADACARAAQHWSEPQRCAPASARSRWWQSGTVVRHIDANICGRPISGLASGDITFLQQRFPGRRFAGAVSVGCGNGYKEMALLEAGLVEHFSLYELSSTRIERGLARAQDLGLEERLCFHRALIDFDAPMGGRFDLVYWNNALHHMLDSEAAVRWSRDVLLPGGVFYMNDFVGPSRMQWTDRMLAVDPTERADSGRILPSVLRFFPDAEVIPTGGVIYHSVLNAILQNFDEEADRPWLDLLLLLDDLCTDLGDTHYAVALGRRP